MNMIQEDILYCLEYCLKKLKENINENIIPCYTGKAVQEKAINNILEYLKKEYKDYL